MSWIGIGRTMWRRAGGSATSSSTLNNGLIFLAKLDETSGSVYDEIGDYEGTPYSGVTINQDGKLNRAIYLDGTTGAYVDFGDVGGVMDFGTTQDFTMAVWIKCSNSGSSLYQYFFEKYLPSARGYGLYFQDDDGLAIFIRDVTSGDSITAKIPVATKNFIDGNWHLVIGEFDRSTQINIIGDISYSQETAYDTSTWVVATDNPLTLGINYTSGGYTGYLDQPMVWNRLLTTDEKNELYNSGAGKTYPF